MIATLLFLAGGAAFPVAAVPPSGSSPLPTSIRAAGGASWAIAAAIVVADHGWTVGLALACGASMLALMAGALLIPLLAGRS